MTDMNRKGRLKLLGGFLILCLCFSLLLLFSVRVEAAGIKPTTLNITADALRTTPAQWSNVRVNGGGFTWKKNYTDTSAGQALIEVSGTVLIYDLKIDGNCGVRQVSGGWSATNTAGNQPLIRVKSGASLTLSGCTLTNNYSFANGGGIVVEEGGTLILENTGIGLCMSEGNGGGIYSNGKVTMTSGMITENYAANDGGGIYIQGVSGDDPMSLTIEAAQGTAKEPNHLAITNNCAGRQGGGICAMGWDAIQTDGTHVYYGSVQLSADARYAYINISGNTAATSGGGIYTATLPGSGLSATGDIRILQNTANNGGGIYGDRFVLGTGSFSSSKVQITNNTAKNGGGAYVTDYAELDRVTVSGNSATIRGGGVYAITSDSEAYSYDGVKLTDNTLIKENHANSYGGGIYLASAGMHLAGFPCIRGNTASGSGTSAADNVYLAKNGSNLGARIVIPSGVTALTATSLSGEMAVPIGLSSSVIQEGVGNNLEYLTLGWQESFDANALFTSNSVRFTIGNALLNGELCSYYCGKITFYPGEGTGDTYVRYYSTEGGSYLLDAPIYGYDPDNGEEATPVFTRTGYTQNGWTVNNVPLELTGGTVVAYGGLDVIAMPRWKGKVYCQTLQFSPRQNPVKKYFTYGNVFNFTTPTVTGYTLLGWSLDPNATEPEFFPGYSNTWLYAEDTTFYAVWEFTGGTKLFLDGNGGQDYVADVLYNQTVTIWYGGEPGTGGFTTIFGEMNTIPRENNPFVPGYDFVGYTLTKDGDDILIDSFGTVDEDRIYTDYLNSSGKWIYTGETLTLYAKYEKDFYNLYTDLQDGSTPTNQGYGAWYGRSTAVWLETPTRAGYDFIGWYTKAVGGEPLGETIPDTLGNKFNRYVYAHWEASPAVGIVLIEGSLQKSYYAGGSLLLGSATLSIEHENGSTTSVAVNEEMISGFSTSVPVANAIATVTYEGYTATFTYTVLRLAAVSGTVSGSGEGEVLIRLFDAQDSELTAAAYSTFTATGSYTLSELLPGNYILLATKDGYLPARYTVTVTDIDVVQEITLTEQIGFVGSRLNLGDALDIFFGVLESKLDPEEDYYAVVERSYADGSKALLPPEEVIVDMDDWSYDSATGAYMIEYSGVAVKEMCDAFTVVLYRKSDNAAISTEWNDSISAYCQRYINQSTTQAKEKTMVVNLVNYGAAAQVYFGYDETNLANSWLTDAQKLYATETPTDFADRRVQGANYLGTALNLESRTMLSFLFANVTSDMYAEISYTDHRGNQKSDTIQGSAFRQEGANKIIDVNTLALAEYASMVTVVIYDADGNEVARAQDSIDSYLARIMILQPNEPLYAETAKAMVGAYQYFH